MAALEDFVNEHKRFPAEGRTRSAEEESLAMEARRKGLLKPPLQPRIQELQRIVHEEERKVASANEAPPAEDIEVSASSSAVAATNMRSPEAAFGEPSYGTLGWRSIPNASRVLKTVAS